ncbi:MacS family sensor histidine kinase [Streptomyces sp. NPDC050560]|uniref:MacS family sensor histidine kinase n=1 Tax=Streptomyces sp. NPDC050560 TaxID=3365630 RepID=UPI00378D5E2C
MTGRGRVMRMSVEQPMWQALIAYRLLTVVYAVCIAAFGDREYERPGVAVCYLVALALWNVATVRRISTAAACTRGFLAADLCMAVAGILLTPLAAGTSPAAVGGPTLPTIWSAGSVLAYALKGGWRWAAGASTLVGVADIAQRGTPTWGTLHNVLLVWVAAIAIGYVVEVARASERTLARALEIEAATRERERLARDIHDSVLQVLAMVQRRGTALGGEAAELGRLAGEQEVALRTLVTGAAPAPAEEAPPGRAPAAVRKRRPAASAGPGGESDVRPLLAPYAGSLVTFAEPGAPVPLPGHAARELAAAVGAALDNVRVHAGPGARAWILVEDEPDAVTVTVRDDGPGIPEGRLAEAEGEGRLGVALSIKGRLRDIGGTAALVSVPGQGTEVELTVPRTGRGERA